MSIYFAALSLIKTEPNGNISDDENDNVDSLSHTEKYVAKIGKNYDRNGNINDSFVQTNNFLDAGEYRWLRNHFRTGFFIIKLDLSANSNAMSSFCKRPDIKRAMK